MSNGNGGTNGNGANGSPGSHWAIDKRVNLGSVIAIGIQCVAIISVAAVGLFRLDVLEQNAEKNSTRIEKVEDAVGSLDTIELRLNTLNAKQDRMDETIQEIRDEVVR